MAGAPDRLSPQRSGSQPVCRAFGRFGGCVLSARAFDANAFSLHKSRLCEVVQLLRAVRLVPPHQRAGNCHEVIREPKAIDFVQIAG